MDQHGGGARFQQQKINHSRPEQLSGVPRHPGRPNRSKDAMPRQRTSEKPNVPAWAMSMLNPKGMPDWAVKEREKFQQQARPYQPLPQEAQTPMAQKPTLPQNAQPQPLPQQGQSPIAPSNLLTGSPHPDIEALRKRLAMIRAGLGGGVRVQ